MTLLAGLRVAQLGPGTAAAVCGRLLADIGASVWCDAAEHATRLDTYLDQGKAAAGEDTLAAADLIICEGSPKALSGRGHDVSSLRARAPMASVVLISPFGQTGPQAEDPATDLTLFAASGISRLLTGQVDDLTEPPIRPVGTQSAFIGGLAAACAGMHACLTDGASVIDVSIQEALATLAMTELARAGQTGTSWRRRREADGNGATVCILPAHDGYAAISPREERQWRAWLLAMGSPAWGNDARFARKPDRIANWDALHALMMAWSRDLTKQQIADLAQAAHVPSFPLRDPTEMLGSTQLAHRAFWKTLEIEGRFVQAPGSPFGLQLRATEDAAAPVDPAPLPPAKRRMPLAGVRVLDFSWVIAGPTATRYLAAMGAEVIKVEAPGTGDPGRASGLHDVLGQAKRGIMLDLKQPAGLAAARALAERCDVLVENFATGVMDRLGLGPDALRELNPHLIYVSASGLGRTGPEANAVAYGTILQCYAGFAGLNRHPDRSPRVGMAWLDPMCGLMLALVVAAGLWQRQRSGTVARVDFSMIEALLWTMADPLLAAQTGQPAEPRGASDETCAPHGVYRCAGNDAWVALAVRNGADWRGLTDLIPELRTLSGLSVVERRSRSQDIDQALARWCASQDAPAAAALLVQVGVPAAPVSDSLNLVESPHLRARGFWDAHGCGVLPGLPWRASFGRSTGPAPGLGADTDAVLAEISEVM